MSALILRRLAALGPVFLGVTALVFLLIRAAPGDAAAMLLAERGVDLSPETVAAARAELGLDKPLAVQYAAWLGGVLRLDLGRSLVSGEPVTALLARRFRATAALSLPSLALALLIALPAGAAAALRRDGPADRAGRLFSVVFLSLPPYSAGLLLISLFAQRLRLLPSFGADRPAAFVLPCLTLALPLAARYSRLIRAALLEQISKNFVLAAQARGLSRKRALLVHALATALPGLVTALGVNLALLLGGQAVIETLFSWPGLGSCLVAAALRRDYPVAQGCALLYALLFTTLNLAADLLCLALDPPLRADEP